MRRRGGDDIDDFIASEMQGIEESNPQPRPAASSTGPKGMVGSKPNFGMSGKGSGGGAFAKPTFAKMGGGAKKPTSGPMMVPKSSIAGAAAGPPKITLKRRQQDDDFINQELAQINQNAN